MKLRAYAPASIGNFAAGFDLMGAALAPLDGSLWGDVVASRARGRDRAHRLRPLRRQCSPRTRGRTWCCAPTRCSARSCAAAGSRCRRSPSTWRRTCRAAAAWDRAPAQWRPPSPPASPCWAPPCPPPRSGPLAGRAEALVSGSPHLDNVVPCLAGGLQLLVPDRDGLPDARALPWPDDLVLVVASPAFELSTDAEPAGAPPPLRPRHGPSNSPATWRGFVHALDTGDRDLLRRCLRDPLAEPYRAPLVPGFRAAQAAAMAAGAWGCTLSGSGPALFAVAESPAHGREVADALQGGLRGAGLDSTAKLCGLDLRGLRE